MKLANALLLAIFFLTQQTAFGQEEIPPVTNPSDTTKINIGDLKVIVIDEDTDSDDHDHDHDDDHKFDKDNVDRHDLTFWAGMDVGVNMLVNKDGGTDLGEGNEWLDLNEAKSLQVSLNIFEEKIRIFKEIVGITTGLGLTYNSYGLADSVVVQNNADSVFAVYNDLSFTKNKLRATYVKVPLLLEINTSRDPERTFHVAAGAIGGVRIGSITKRQYEVDGNKHKDRTKGDFNLQPFTLDATVRVGYRNFTLYANYGLTPLFEKDKGPEVYPVTVGLTVIPF